MPDILHWLGITRITRLLSMSNMKYDAIIQAGITVGERVELPESWIPADSRVEIDAKITAGMFPNSHSMRLTLSPEGRILYERSQIDSRGTRSCTREVMGGVSDHAYLDQYTC
jgi:hypothetical protein